MIMLFKIFIENYVKGLQGLALALLNLILMNIVLLHNYISLTLKILLLNYIVIFIIKCIMSSILEMCVNYQLDK